MLNQKELKKLIQEKKLITGYLDLTTQLTPNGFDLTAQSIFKFLACGALDFSNKERVVPQGEVMLPKKKNKNDKFGWWHLKKGAYKVRTNEAVNLPLDLTAIAFSRTSLLRVGGFTQHGVWDAGFRGRAEFILVVENPGGLRLKENARLAQLVFLRINKLSRGYRGIYRDLK